MQNKADKAALLDTLERAGTSVCDSPRWLAYGGADGTTNDSVRLAANDLLFDLAKENRVGRCIHITGEMRALADPFHRRICAEIRRRTDHKFSLLYDIPGQYRGTPQGLAAWNAQKWKGSRWVDRLSAFNIIGRDIVDVYAYDTLDKIQFSVFGDRYILLQGKHKDLSKTQASAEKVRKKVWLLESEPLHEAFCNRAEKMTMEAEVIPDALFKQFPATVHGVTSREILRRLIENGGAGRYERVLDDDLRYFDDKVESCLSALKTIEFVTSDKDGNLHITDDGRQYYSETQARRPSAGGTVEHS
jgi:hypothetical protein